MGAQLKICAPPLSNYFRRHCSQNNAYRGSLRTYVYYRLFDIHTNTFDCWTSICY